jgi:hypothetical protein
LSKIFVSAPEFIRVASFPLSLSDGLAFRLMQFVAKALPFAVVACGMFCEKPFVPFAR